MDKQQFITTTGLSSVADISELGAESSKTDETKKMIPPVVMAPRNDGVEIVWMVSGLKKGYVEYGITRNLGSNASEAKWQTNHHN